MLRTALPPPLWRCLALTLALALALILALVWCGAALAQAATPPARESTVKAAFIYRFGGFVEWPAGTFAHPNDPVVIGVAGDDQVASDLEEMVLGRTLAGRPLQVVRVRNTQALESVNILYLGSTRNGRTRDLVPAAKAPVLVVSEKEDAARLGAALFFEPEGGRIRFSAAPAAAESRGLRLSARLLAVAQNVEGHPR